MPELKSQMVRPMERDRNYSEPLKTENRLATIFRRGGHLLRAAWLIRTRPIPNKAKASRFVSFSSMVCEFRNMSPASKTTPMRHNRQPKPPVMACNIFKASFGAGSVQKAVQKQLITKQYKSQVWCAMWNETGRFYLGKKRRVLYSPLAVGWPPALIVLNVRCGSSSNIGGLYGSSFFANH